MRHVLLAVFGTLPLLISSLCAQETPAANKIVRSPRATNFPVWLTKKVDVRKIRVGDQVRFKSERAFLLGTTVVQSAIFHGRIVYVQTVAENEERESRLGIAVEAWSGRSHLCLCMRTLWASARIGLELIGMTPPSEPGPRTGRRMHPTSPEIMGQTQRIGEDCRCFLKECNQFTNHVTS